MAFSLRSPAFAEGSTIPKQYTLDGENLSPPLEWNDVPRGTKSFAVLCEDPDAPSGTFRHWAACNIAADRQRLLEGAGGDRADEWTCTRNDFGHARYDGPRPPHGHGLHHYHFRIAALDVDHLDVSRNQSAEQLWQAARPHVLAEAETVGTYQR